MSNRDCELNELKFIQRMHKAVIQSIHINFTKKHML